MAQEARIRTIKVREHVIEPFLCIFNELLYNTEYNRECSGKL